MTYIPKKDKKAQNISLVLILMGIAVFALSNFVSYRAVFQIIALAVIASGVQILVRYVLSEFVYIIDDRDDGNSDLIIIKKQGKRETKVCHLTLSSVEEVFPRGSKKAESRTRFSYVQNMGANAHVILFRDGDKLVEVIFESDCGFVDALRDRIGSDTSGEQTVFAM